MYSGKIIEEKVVMCKSKKGLIFERRIVRRAPSEEEARKIKEREEAERREHARERGFLEGYQFCDDVHVVTMSMIEEAIAEYFNDKDEYY